MLQKTLRRINNMYSITSKAKPKWHDIRWKLSNYFVRAATWIYPENPEVKAFFMQSMIDQMIYGQSVIRIDPSKVVDEPNKD